MIGGICTVLGYVLVFVPLQYTVALYLVLPGMLLAFLGMGMLVTAMIIYSRRVYSSNSQRYERNFSLSYSSIRGSYKVIIVGIIALIAARIVQGLVWPLPAELSSQTSTSLAQYLGDVIIGGMFWGFLISYYFVRYSYKIPLASPVYRSLVITFLAVLIVDGLATLFHLNHAAGYFLWDLLYSIPRYFAFGIVVGYSYEKFNSEKTIQTLLSRPTKRRARIYYLLIIAVVMGASIIYSNYTVSLETSSFTASDIHFVTSNGIIHTIANITNPSQSSLIQVNAAIDGLDDGICGYGIDTNHTMMCNFYSPSGGVPLLLCSQLPVAENYTLTLNAYFSSMKTVINTYTIGRNQLGCPSLNL